MIESRLGGAGVWDVLLPAGEAIDGKVLGDMARLEHRLRTEVTIPDRDGRAMPALTKVMGLADVMAAVSPIPLERLQSTRVGNWLVTGALDVMQSQVPQLSRTFIGHDPDDGSTWLRVMLRAHERQPAPQKRAIIEQDLQSRKDDLTVSEAQSAGALAQKKAAEASQQSVKVLLDRLTVRAPRDGTILQLRIRAGEWAGTDAKNPSLILGRTDILQARVDIDEQNALRIRDGQKAVAHIKGDRDNPITLKLEYIEPYVVPKTSLTGASTERVDTRVLQVIFSFTPQQGQRVYVGQQVDVFIEE
jgi:hypothetical protein